jgi:hypothetical protein
LFCVGLLTIALGYAVSRGYGLALIGIMLFCGVAAWAAPRPAAIPLVMLGVVLLPTPAIQLERFHGLPLTTTLTTVTTFAVLCLWWHRRAGQLRPHVSPYAIAALLVLLLTALIQLVTSHDAGLRPVYQLLPMWLSGLLLGCIVASDRRMTDQVGLLALPVAMLAIFEFVTHDPSLWSHLVRANLYEALSSAHGALRATSTFGHPLVAGTALVIMSFIVLVLPGTKRVVLFSLIAAGAVVTVSGSALVGLAAGLLAHLVGNARQRMRVLGAIVAVVVTGWLLLTLIPSLHASFESRVLSSGGVSSEQSESVRLNSLKTLENSINEGATVLLTGRGLGGTERYLAETGGNLGFNTYDNQYVTSIYDSGVLVVLAVIGLILIGTIQARPGWRTVAPLVVASTTAFFFNALYWPVTGLLFWLTVGLATAPHRQDAVAADTDEHTLGLSGRELLRAPRPSSPPHALPERA